MKWFQWIKNWRKQVLSSEEEAGTPSSSEESLPEAIGEEGISVGEMKKLIIKNFPPFTWEKIGLYLYNDFQKAGLPFTHLDDKEILSLDLVLKINSTLKLLYNKRLPLTINKKQLS